uniref:Uncharacterized protein n=1 Tax=Avena sativa TaxID=4498 RepID=A0ACD5ZS53_AVESA
MADCEQPNGNGHVTVHQQQPPAAPAEDQDQAAAGAGAEEEAELLWKLRKYLVLLAILAAAITYQAGLAPPGGFWQETNHGHLASDIVLRSSYPRRYLVFFYCNTTAFVASLMVLVLLLVRELSRNAVWLRSLQLAMILCLLGLMGAFAAGSCREVRASLYIWALMLGIFAYITLHVVFFLHFAPPGLRRVFSGIRARWKQTLERVFGVESDRNDEEETTDEKEELERNRSSLLVLATLAATVTYAAGLSPPGGFWSDDGGDYLAGDPVLRAHYPRRFKAFLVCNATAFAGSLVIIIMLLSETAVSHVVRSNALRLCVLVSLFGIMGAYAAGSCREVKTSIYVFALVGAVLLYLVVQFIEPIVPKPDCVGNTVAFVKEKKKAMLKKLNDFIINLLEEPEPEHGSSNNNNNGVSSTVKHDLQKLRTYLLLLGILAATVTYQAGLNPPGGFWTDNSDGHTAGDPILKDVSPRRYKVFFYCNATAFVASLVIIILLQSHLITMRAMKRYVLQTAMALVLFGLMGAYAAGSSRKFSTSLYVIILVLLVFSYVVLHALLYVALKTRWRSRIEEIGDSISTSEFLHHFSGSVETVDEVEGKDLRKRRKFLMLLAILAASVTYQAGISPPGGFWTDNRNGHRAGDSVFRDEFRTRYRVFFYFNATAFMASLAVILLLVSKRLCHRGLKCYALRACVLVDLISLLGAFAAGSCRKVSTSAYVILVVVAVFVYVMIQVLVLTFAKDKVADILDLLQWIFKARPFERQDPSMNRRSSTGAGKRREHKWRKDLMLIGTLAITVTYQAGLLPPGGAWPDDQDGHFAGDPILHDINLTRYKVFFYCNATAFMASMVMVLLLLNNTISKYKRSLLAMKTAMIFDLLGLLGAYAAGSCRKLKTSVYIFALVIAVFIYIVIHVLLSFDKVAMLVKEKGKKWIPCLKTSALVGTESNNQPSVGEPGQVPLCV